jgi:hypothetical protein
MANIKYGAIITEIKGKVGGSVFQSNKAGFTMKNKPKIAIDRAKARTFGDGHQNLLFSSAIKNWSQITEANRSSWSALVGTWQFNNKFGDVYNGSPYQIQNSCNINRQLLELAMLAPAPTYNPAVDPGLSYANFSLSGTFNGTIANAGANGQLVYVEASQPVNPTKNISRVQFRKFGVIVSAAGTANYKAAYIAWLGFTPALGTVFYIRTWTAWADYPRQQFNQLHRVEIVA